MEKRKLGSAGPEVPVICLGGNVYGWTVAEAEAFRQLDAALDAGLNFVDTADVINVSAQTNDRTLRFPVFVNHLPIMVSDSPPLCPGNHRE